MICHHYAARSKRVPYIGAVANRPNPLAHDGFTRIETCICGASRRINVNGDEHCEYGPWIAAQFARAMLRADHRLCTAEYVVAPFYAEHRESLLRRLANYFRSNKAG